jgi:hypothetical protein
VGLYDLVELSYARQSFDTLAVGSALGLGDGFKFDVDVYGLKVKVAGDAVLDQDTWLPQIAVGAQYKKNDQGEIVRAVSAKRDCGTDFYIAATKVFLNQSLSLNGTLRATKANQLGIPVSAATTRTAASPSSKGPRRCCCGATWRSALSIAPSRTILAVPGKTTGGDVFVAWAPTKNVSLTPASVNPGNVVIRDDQKGLYLSLQIAF